MPILVLFAHPAFHTSRVHRRLVERVGGLAGVRLHDLYQAYPDFDVDVRAEQQLLLEHDLIVLQHPLYWYSVPPLLKQWFDLVLEHGWAYGTKGVALRGKRALTVVSAGGREDAYGPEGRNRFTVRQLLAPVEQTMRLCGIEYLPPFVVHGTHRLGSEEIGRAADAYARLLVALRDGTLAPGVLEAREHLDPEWAPVAGG